MPLTMPRKAAAAVTVGPAVAASTSPPAAASNASETSILRLPIVSPEIVTSSAASAAPESPLATTTPVSAGSKPRRAR
jgi:hypothetical protein